jgi:hypothetical protein
LPFFFADLESSAGILGRYRLAQNETTPSFKEALFQKKTKIGDPDDFHLNISRSFAGKKSSRYLHPTALYPERPYVFRARSEIHKQPQFLRQLYFSDVCFCFNPQQISEIWTSSLYDPYQPGQTASR